MPSVIDGAKPRGSGEKQERRSDRMYSHETSTCRAGPVGEPGRRGREPDILMPYYYSVSYSTVSGVIAISLA